MTGTLTADTRACVIGLGYVGLTLAVALAEVGVRVCGVERSAETAATISRGTPHFMEDGLAPRLKAVIESGALTIHTSIPDEPASTVFIITVGTPIDPRKRVRIAPLQQAVRQVAQVLRDEDLVILRSTVGVGCSRDVVWPILAETGRNVRLAFCPERTIEGKAMLELRSLPQIVGGIDAASRARASAFFRHLTEEIVEVSSLESAEMVKLINNTYRDLIFAFANEVAAAAEVAGVSAIETLKAANYKYPRGGVPLPGPVGGPCLEKDPHILAEAFVSHGFVPEIALTARRFNEGLPERVALRLKKMLGERARDVSRVAVLGLAFKGQPATSDMRGSLAIPLVEELRKTFLRAAIIGHDSLVPAGEAAKHDIDAVDTRAAAISGADIVILQTNHSELRELDLEAVAGVMRPGGIIYDLWSMHGVRPIALGNGVTYTALGLPTLENAIPS